jgi:hypothetical protein
MASDVTFLGPDLIIQIRQSSISVLAKFRELAAVEENACASRADVEVDSASIFAFQSDSAVRAVPRHGVSITS